MYDKFLMYVILPIAFGIMIAIVVSGSKKNIAERNYYIARTHQILHELRNSGCEHYDFTDWNGIIAIVGVENND